MPWRAQSFRSRTASAASRPSPTSMTRFGRTAQNRKRLDGMRRALVAGGIVLLAVNHVLVVAAHRKSLELVLGGAVFLTVGIGGCVHPLFIPGRQYRSERAVADLVVHRRSILHHRRGLGPLRV